MSTVREVLDQLANGSVTLDEAAADFAARDWPAAGQPSESQVWGVDDDPEPDPNSWDAVNADSRLSPEQYEALSRARLGA